MGLFGRKTDKRDDGALTEEAVGLAATPAPDANGLRDPDAHRAWVLAQVRPLSPLGLGLVDATGLVLDEDLHAEAECPDADLAGVTGFAVLAAGLGGASARQQGKAPAARVVPVRAGQALPEGTDTVIPNWMAQPSPDGVLRLTGKVRRGDWVRPTGLDAHIGETLARVGDVVTPTLAARLAQAGFDRVIVRPRVRAVVVGFDETTPAPGAAHLGTPASYLVAMALREQGVTTHRVGVAADDPDAIRETVGNELIRSDLVVCCGGFEDPDSPAAQVVADLGLLDVAALALEPGGRHAFGLMGAGEVPLLGLPGQPLGALTGYLCVVRPVLRVLAGAGAEQEDVQIVRTVAELPAPGDLTRFVFGRLVHEDGVAGVRPSGAAGQCSLGDLVSADVAIVLPAGGPAVRAGDPVRCWPLGL